MIEAAVNDGIRVCALVHVYHLWTNILFLLFLETDFNRRRKDKIES